MQYKHGDRHNINIFTPDDLIGKYLLGYKEDYELKQTISEWSGGSNIVVPLIIYYKKCPSSRDIHKFACLRHESAGDWYSTHVRESITLKWSFRTCRYFQMGEVMTFMLCLQRNKITLPKPITEKIFTYVFNEQSYKIVRCQHDYCGAKPDW